MLKNKILILLCLLLIVMSMFVVAGDDDPPEIDLEDNGDGTVTLSQGDDKVTIFKRDYDRYDDELEEGDVDCLKGACTVGGEDVYITGIEQNSNGFSESTVIYGDVTISTFEFNDESTLTYNSETDEYNYNGEIGSGSYDASGGSKEQVEGLISDGELLILGEGDEISFLKIKTSGDTITISEVTISEGVLEDGSSSGSDFTGTQREVITDNGNIESVTTIEFIGGEELADQGQSLDNNGDIEYTWSTTKVVDKDGEDGSKTVRTYSTPKGGLVGYSDGTNIGSDFDDGDITYISANGKWTGELTEEGESNLEAGKQLQKSDFKAEEGENPNECESSTCKGVKAGVRSNTFETSLSYIGQGQYVSNLLFGDAYIKEGVARWDRHFANTVLSEQYWESAVCSWTYPDVQDQNVAMIETPAGTLQAVASVQAEKLVHDTMLCSFNEESQSYNDCGDKYSCQNDLCVDETGQAVPGALYKITWGVSAPRDETFTPNVDEDSIGVTYNILIGGNDLENIVQLNPDNACANDASCVRYYSYEGNSQYPLGLDNGNRDGAVIVEWSENIEYSTVCIVWGRAPVTVFRGAAFPGHEKRTKANAETRSGAFGSKTDSRGGAFLDHFCNDIEDSVRGPETFNLEAGNSRSKAEDSSENKPSTTTAQSGITTNQI